MHAHPLSDRSRATIARLLATRGISGRQLARLTGLNYNAIARRLSGKTYLTVDDLGRIADALDVAPADLLDDAA